MIDKRSEKNVGNKFLAMLCLCAALSRRKRREINKYEVVVVLSAYVSTHFKDLMSGEDGPSWMHRKLLQPANFSFSYDEADTYNEHHHHSITNFPCFGVEYVSCKLHNNLSRNCLNWKTQTIIVVVFRGNSSIAARTCGTFLSSAAYFAYLIFYSQQLWAQIGTLRSSFLFWWDPNRLTHSKVYPTKTLSIYSFWTHSVAK